MKRIKSIILAMLTVLLTLPASAQVIDDSGETRYEKIITWMYPGPGQIFSWGENLTEENLVEENGDNYVKISHSGAEDKWLAQFAYDCLYRAGETYYFTFDVKGDPGVITSEFQNSDTYEVYGSFNDFEITPEWTTVTIKGRPVITSDIVNRWVVNVGDYYGTFWIRNLKLYTLVDEPVVPVVPDNQIIIAELYPGPYQLMRWGDTVTSSISRDEDGGECQKFENSLPDPEMPWSVQFAFDYPYEIGKTYYFKFDVKGDKGVITSQFENSDTYTNCGSCNDFEITPEWRTVIVKGRTEDIGEAVNRWVANIGDYEGTFYLRNMKIYTLINETFPYEGINYAILDAEAKTCMIVGPDSVDGVVTVPEVVPYQSAEYTVVEIADRAFAENANLLAISLPATVQTVGNSIFNGCERLASIAWRGNGKMPYALVDGIENPNLLVYVDAEQCAPDGMTDNVVAAGVCKNLVLTPGYPLAPYQEFTARNSRMTKEFMQQTPFDGCAGWETIVLPFEDVKITSPEGKNLLPFSAVSDPKKQRPFWLYEADPEGEWMAADSIKAGIPYLIAMPNNPRYDPAYNVQGAVTFSSSKSQLISPATTAPYAVTWASGREFRSLWLPLTEAEAAEAMGLNVNIADMTGDDGQLLAPGSAFCADVLPLPLEAYVSRSSSSKAFLISGLQSGVLEMPEADGLKIAQDGGTVILESSIDRQVEIFAPDGTLLRRANLLAGIPTYIDGLPGGLCLIAGRKLIIR